MPLKLKIIIPEVVENKSTLYAVFEYKSTGHATLKFYLNVLVIKRV